MNPLRSNIKLYWVCWLVCVFLLLMLRFTLYSSSPEDARFHLIIAFALITWIPTGFLSLYESYRLRAYLRDNHAQMWERITYSTTGMFNIHSIPFILSSEDLGDQSVRYLKSNFKRFWAFALTQFFFLFVLSLVVLID